MAVSNTKPPTTEIKATDSGRTITKRISDKKNKFESISPVK
jgi:hypothetical protein